MWHLYQPTAFSWFFAGIVTTLLVGRYFLCMDALFKTKFLPFRSSKVWMYVIITFFIFGTTQTIRQFWAPSSVCTFVLFRIGQYFAKNYIHSIARVHLSSIFRVTTSFHSSSRLPQPADLSSCWFRHPWQLSACSRYDFNILGGYLLVQFFNDDIFISASVQYSWQSDYSPARLS
jgi:hypothetical protein